MVTNVLVKYLKFAESEKKLHKLMLRPQSLHSMLFKRSLEVENRKPKNLQEPLSTKLSLKEALSLSLAKMMAFLVGPWA